VPKIENLHQLSDIKIQLEEKNKCYGLNQVECGDTENKDCYWNSGPSGIVINDEGQTQCTSKYKDQLTERLERTIDDLTEYGLYEEKLMKINPEEKSCTFRFPLPNEKDDNLHMNPNDYIKYLNDYNFDIEIQNTLDDIYTKYKKHLLKEIEEYYNGNQNTGQIDHIVSKNRVLDDLATYGYTIDMTYAKDENPTFTKKKDSPLKRTNTAWSKDISKDSIGDSIAGQSSTASSFSPKVKEDCDKKVYEVLENWREQNRIHQKMFSLFQHLKEKEKNAEKNSKELKKIKDNKYTLSKEYTKYMKEREVFDVANNKKIEEKCIDNIHYYVSSITLLEYNYPMIPKEGDVFIIKEMLTAQALHDYSGIILIGIEKGSKIFIESIQDIDGDDWVFFYDKYDSLRAFHLDIDNLKNIKKDSIDLKKQFFGRNWKNAKKEEVETYDIISREMQRTSYYIKGDEVSLKNGKITVTAKIHNVDNGIYEVSFNSKWKIYEKDIVEQIKFETFQTWTSQISKPNKNEVEIKYTKSDKSIYCDIEGTNIKCSETGMEGKLEKFEDENNKQLTIKWDTGETWEKTIPKEISGGDLILDIQRLGNKQVFDKKHDVAYFWNDDALPTHRLKIKHKFENQTRKNRSESSVGCLNNEVRTAENNENLWKLVHDDKVKMLNHYQMADTRYNIYPGNVLIKFKNTERNDTLNNISALKAEYRVQSTNKDTAQTTLWRGDIIKNIKHEEIYRLFKKKMYDSFEGLAYSYGFSVYKNNGKKSVLELLKDDKFKTVDMLNKPWIEFAEGDKVFVITNNDKEHKTMIEKGTVESVQMDSKMATIKVESKCKTIMAICKGNKSVSKQVSLKKLRHRSFVENIQKFIKSNKLQVKVNIYQVNNDNLALRKTYTYDEEERISIDIAYINEENYLSERFPNIYFLLKKDPTKYHVEKENLIPDPLNKGSYIKINKDDILIEHYKAIDMTWYHIESTKQLNNFKYRSMKTSEFDNIKSIPIKTEEFYVGENVYYKEIGNYIQEGRINNIDKIDDLKSSIRIGTDDEADDIEYKNIHKIYPREILNYKSNEKFVKLPRYEKGTILKAFNTYYDVKEDNKPHHVQGFKYTHRWNEYIKKTNGRCYFNGFKTYSFSIKCEINDKNWPDGRKFPLAFLTYTQDIRVYDYFASIKTLASNQIDKSVAKNLYINSKLANDQMNNFSNISEVILGRKSKNNPIDHKNLNDRFALASSRIENDYFTYAVEYVRLDVRVKNVLMDERLFKIDGWELYEIEDLDKKKNHHYSHAKNQNWKGSTQNVWYGDGIVLKFSKTDRDAPPPNEKVIDEQLKTLHNTTMHVNFYGYLQFRYDGIKNKDDDIEFMGYAAQNRYSLAKIFFKPSAYEKKASSNYMRMMQSYTSVDKRIAIISTLSGLIIARFASALSSFGAYMPVGNTYVAPTLAVWLIVSGSYGFLFGQHKSVHGDLQPSVTSRYFGCVINHMIRIFNKYHHYNIDEVTDNNYEKYKFNQDWNFSKAYYAMAIFALFKSYSIKLISVWDDSLYSALNMWLIKSNCGPNGKMPCYNRHDNTYISLGDNGEWSYTNLGEHKAYWTYYENIFTGENITPNVTLISMRIAYSVFPFFLFARLNSLLKRKGYVTTLLIFGSILGFFGNIPILGALVYGVGVAKLAFQAFSGNFIGFGWLETPDYFGDGILYNLSLFLLFFIIESHQMIFAVCHLKVLKLIQLFRTTRGFNQRGATNSIVNWPQTSIADTTMESIKPGPRNFGSTVKINFSALVVAALWYGIGAPLEIESCTDLGMLFMSLPLVVMKVLMNQYNFRKSSNFVSFFAIFAVLFGFISGFVEYLHEGVNVAYEYKPGQPNFEWTEVFKGNFSVFYESSTQIIMVWFFLYSLVVPMLLYLSGLLSGLFFNKTEFKRVYYRALVNKFSNYDGLNIEVFKLRLTGQYVTKFLLWLKNTVLGSIVNMWGIRNIITWRPNDDGKYYDWAKNLKAQVDLYSETQIRNWGSHHHLVMRETFKLPELELFRKELELYASKGLTKEMDTLTDHIIDLNNQFELERKNVSVKVTTNMEFAGDVKIICESEGMQNAVTIKESEYNKEMIVLENLEKTQKVECKTKITECGSAIEMKDNLFLFQCNDIYY